MRDPYSVLGLSRAASSADIKAAYRRLAKKYHPDLHSGDEAMRARFHEVTEAYELLRDDKGARKTGPKPRQARPKNPKATSAPRDFRTSPPWYAKNMSGSPSGGESFFTSDAGTQGAGGRDDGLFGDLFEGLKNAGKRAVQSRGEDRTYPITISFEEAAKGTVHRLRLPTGKVLDVKIPAGVDDGQQIRLKGQGKDGTGGGEPGDGLIIVHIKPHALFRREGRDIYFSLPVSLREAVLGAKVTVPTLAGPVAVTVPPGSNNGAKLRIKNKGIQSGDGAKKRTGDQYVILDLRLPAQSDAALEKFVKTWKQGIIDDPRGEQK